MNDGESIKKEISNVRNDRRMREGGKDENEG